MSITRGGESSRERASPTAVRILAAARRCFERAGIEKTTIVDIAEAASYSRPVVYKHFADKAAIVDGVCLEEMREVQAALDRRLPRDLPFDARLGEAILQAVLLARTNPYIARFMQDHDAWVRSQTRAGRVHVWVRERWRSFVRRGQRAGVLAGDLDVEQTVTWISMVQSLLLLRYAGEAVDEEEMRRFVRRFVVTPLLSTRVDPASFTE